MKIGALLTVEPWEGYRAVGRLPMQVLSRLPLALASRDVEMTYEQNLHILTRRDDEDVPYVAGQVYNSLAAILSAPEYLGVQSSHPDRVDFAVCGFNGQVDRYVLAALKGITAARSARGKDEILFNTGWVGGEVGLAGWIRTHNLIKL